MGRPASGKTASLQTKNTFNSSQNLIAPGEQYDDLKLQNKSDVPGISSKKKTADTKSIIASCVSLKASKDDAPTSVTEAKDADKQKTGASQSKNLSDKYKDASGLFNASHQKHHEKGAYAHSKHGRPSSNINDLENTGQSKEKNGMCELPDLNLSEGKSAMQATVSFYLFQLLWLEMMEVFKWNVMHETIQLVPALVLSLFECYAEIWLHAQERWF